MHLSNSRLAVLGYMALSLVINMKPYCQDIRKGDWINCGENQATHSQRVSATQNTTQVIHTGMFQITMINVPENAVPAIQEAFSMWDEHITTPIPIRIDLQWTSIEGNVLARTQPTTYIRNFSSKVSAYVWYPIALAEKIAERELNETTDFEIKIDLNQQVNWYLGIDGNPSVETYDLVSIMLHEITHGLGFISSASEDGAGVAFSGDGFSTIYDHLLMNEHGMRLYQTSNIPSELEHAVTTNQVYLYSSDKGEHLLNKAYAPVTFRQGVSLSHLDDQHYRDASIMVPFITSGWSQKKIDSTTLSIFRTLGWASLFPKPFHLYPNPVSDFVQVQVPASIDELQIDLYTINGTKISSTKVSNPLKSVFEIDITHLSRGTYIAILQSKNFNLKENIKFVVY